MIIDADGMDHDVPLSDKRAVADAVLDAVVAWRRLGIDPANASGPDRARTQEENL